MRVGCSRAREDKKGPLNSNSVQNFVTLGQPLLGEKYVAQKEEKKEK
jgi:hypothetical protein